MDRRAAPQVPPAAKSNHVGPFSAGFAKVPFGLVAVFLLLVLHSCSGLNLHNDLEKIQAFTGETVVLPCLIKVSGELPTVEWSKEGLTPDITFLYRDGCETFDMKNKVFRDRTNLLMNELKNGNISQMIFNVQLTDAGKYQCVIVRGKTREVVKTLELVVGAFSEPKLSVVPGAGSGLTLECEASCWFPEPNLTFVDDRGNVMTADDPETNQDARGCFNVRKRMTLSTAPNRVLCRVHEPQMNKTSVKEIHYIRGDCLHPSIIPVFIILLLVILGMGAFSFYLHQKRGAAKPPPAVEPTYTVPQYSDEPQVHTNGNSVPMPQHRIEDYRELQNQLHDRDEEIRTLTAKVNQLTSILSSHHTTKSKQRNTVGAGSRSAPALNLIDLSSVSPSGNSSVHRFRTKSHPPGSVTRSNHLSFLKEMNEESDNLLPNET